MFIKSSQKYKIPVDFYLNFGAAESAFGTDGRAIQSQNFANVGNVTAGDYLPTVCGFLTDCLSSWEAGIENFASLISNCYFKPGEEITLDKFIANDFKAQNQGAKWQNQGKENSCPRKGDRYMTSSTAKANHINIQKIIKKITN